MLRREILLLVCSLACSSGIWSSSCAAGLDELGPVKVLLVAERPTWNHRYLTGTLAQDAHVESQAQLLDEKSSIAGEIERHDVLILADVSARVFQHDPKLALRIAGFVEGGGGLVFMPGEAWPAGEHPLAELLPVAGIEPGKLKHHGAPALSRPQITGAGLGSPMLRLVNDPMRNQQLWREELTASFSRPLAVVAKREAIVLAVDPKRRAGGQRIPLVALRRHEKGRVIFLNRSETWRWQAKPIGNHYGRLWRRLTLFAAGKLTN